MQRVIDLLRGRALFPFYEGMLTTRERDGLVLLKYTQRCQNEDAWDDVTRACRGCIIDTRDHSVAARPFTKFFNIGERPETRVEALPRLPFRIFEKMDGSLGTLYRDRDGAPRLATPGSFESAQAQRGTEMLQQLRGIEQIPQELTLCFEIIYRGQHAAGADDNGFSVVHYDFEGLVLLAGFDRFTGEELPWERVEDLASLLGCRLPRTYAFDSIEAAVAAANALPSQMEGFVIRFANGLRVKLKGDAYLTLHRLLWGVSDRSVHERLLDGSYEQFVQGLPEEHRAYVGMRAAPLVEAAAALQARTLAAFAAAPKDDRKTFALWLKANAPADTHSAAFQLMSGRTPNWYEFIAP